jgi:fumarylacetoacetase
MDALEAFRVHQPVQDPAPCAEYLADVSANGDAYDINLSVHYSTPTSGEEQISTSNLKYMYWSFSQQLAHHSVGGCNMRTGDLIGSGTISGPGEGEMGSLLELTWNGTKKLVVGGEERCFIEDGDCVVMKGYCEKDGVRIGFGETRGRVLPAVVRKK